MKHKMNLIKEPFDKIASGQKTIELRLYDEKRRAVGVGDVITFVCTEDSRQISTRVVALYVFDSFEELYKNLPLDRCGYSSDEITSAHWSDMGKYYSEEEMKKYGVVGIELALIK
ncbi:MAG: ASCH domain-containing protein [Clostridia bacterium]|nr:ASCH domain-containing protein [Clostridia bacterium]